MRNSQCFVVAMLFLLSSTLIAKDKSDALKIGARVDCIHNFGRKGSTQKCFQLSGLKVKYISDTSKDSSLSVTINPFGSPSKSLAHQVDFLGNTLPKVSDSSLGYVTDYQLIWQPQPAFQLGLVLYGGSTMLATIHGLSLGSRFQYSGWNQTALKASYVIGKHKNTKLELAIGNGEGETIKNLDPQQYAAIRLQQRLIKGLNAYLGASMDGNNVGSEATKWVYNNDQSEIVAGFSTQRFVLGIYSDGELSIAPGLKLSAAYQSTIIKDLDESKNSASDMSYEGADSHILNYLYLEDPDMAEKNRIEIKVYDLGVSYAIMDTHFLSFNYESRDINTGVVNYFEDDKDQRQSSLRQTAYTAGVGFAMSDRLILTLEYHSETYNKKYKKFFYIGKGRKEIKSMDLFNARVTYDW